MRKPQATITLTPEFLSQLKKAYLAAEDHGQNIITFEGYEYLTSYAKYLSEYGETLYNKGGTK
ncbi:MAG: hypothetical protein A2Y38_19950 [Spirochaetes bacterium GWB1_59_5]|nr:MAG: hypothetical protein A2Y38_19950 [Spirochaetes bacterium GWB1_59_5]